MPRHAPGAARARTVEAAALLFYDRGIPSVSLDDVARAAGVSKATLYAHFTSKDALVAAALDVLGERMMSALHTAMTAAGADPGDRIQSAFAVLAEMAADPAYRGCPYLNAAAQTPDPTVAIHALVHEQVHAHKDELHAIFRSELAAAGHSDPAQGADALLLLLDGALVQTATRPDAEPVTTAQRLVDEIVRVHLAARS